MPEFFKPRAELEVHTRRLPHWQQDETTVFVTWRLIDSMPAEKLARWRSERDAWLRAHTAPWTTVIEAEYHHEFSDRFDAWLDAGHGNCLLRSAGPREAVANTLRHRDGLDYRLHAFVVMPNHVHALFGPTGGTTWSQIVATWKRVSAHRINRMLHREGAVWQEETWDRFVRSASHLHACCRYIRENPVRAGLRLEEFSLFEQAAD